MNPGPSEKLEPLRAAVRDALAGRLAALEDLFRRHGGGPDPRPNLKLAAAFGDEMAALEGGPAPARLLARLGEDDAAPDTFEVFFAMAAAFGWVGRLRARQDVDEAWAALLPLAGDERAPVRVATHAALRAFALVRDGAAQLVAHAGAWLEAEDREVRHGAAAVVVEVLGEKEALAAGTRRGEALAYLSRVLADAANAPRSASRSDGRRRLLAALPRTLSAVATASGEAGVTWLEAECAAASQPEVRGTLSDAVVRLQRASGVLGQRVRETLEKSAKPLRDPSRVRPGAGRGKSSRSTR